MLKPCAQTRDLPGVMFGQDLVLKDASLLLVGNQQDDDVSLAGRVGDLGHLEAGLLGGGPGLRAVVQANHDVQARVVGVQRVRVALAAVADDGDFLALERVDRRFCLGVDVGGHLPSRIQFKLRYQLTSDVCILML